MISICEFRAKPLSHRRKRSPIIDTFLATVLDLLVLEAALLPAESVSGVGKDSIASSIASSIVGSIIRKWTRHSDN
jgi:hypothetical protein